MTIIWTRKGKTVGSEGTTVTYCGLGTTLSIESRKRHIPHANGVGTWDHTSYWVIDNNREIKEMWTLKDAKEFAAKYWEETHETI